MVFEQLENLLTEQGFCKVASNLPEFFFFFRTENTYVNVLHIVDYKQNLYIAEDQYEHIKDKIKDFFHAKGIADVHILSILVSADIPKARKLCGNDAFCWLLDPAENRLLIYEHQVADFYGMKKILENFLYEISVRPSEGNSTSGNPERTESFSAKKGTELWAWGNIFLVAVNVILFIVCTFTGNLLYNIGAFSVRDLTEGGEWYRLLTSIFLHADIRHLVSNMLILYYIGNAVEKQMGHIPYTILYFLSGLAGNIFSAGYELLSERYISSVGASGAVFGVEGALLMLVLLHKGKLADVTAGRIVFVIGFALYCGFTSSYVNNAAHIGGVLMGFIVAGIFWLLSPGTEKEQQKRF